MNIWVSCMGQIVYTNNGPLEHVVSKQVVFITHKRYHSMKRLVMCCMLLLHTSAAGAPCKQRVRIMEVHSDGLSNVRAKCGDIATRQIR